MPEVDGFEVLSQMKDDSRLKHIPVVIMSANESGEIIAGCLSKQQQVGFIHVEMGAADYLVKPIRSGDCKALVSKMNKPTLTPEQSGKLQGLAKFERLRELGHGASGAVVLVSNKQDGVQYALKQINLKDLQYLTEKDRKNAENEVEFLKVLVGPTLIKYYENFIENNCIYIVMEYAECGSLGDLIYKRYIQGKKFEYEEIMQIMAQITLGVMSIHSRYILHRDIKTQNIFITKDNILKIGDFGISRQLTGTQDLASTVKGTPYFMPPEVCQGK